MLVFGGISACEAGARTIVVSATGPSSGRFTAGVLLSEPLRIELARGDRIVLLDDAGTRELQGPAKIREDRARAASAASTSLFTSLGQRMAERRARAAAVRNIPGETPTAAPAPPPPVATGNGPLFDVDPSIEGNWCVPDLESVELWRADADKGMGLSITSSDGGTTTARWSKGEHSLYWPGGGSPRMGERYLLQVGDEKGAYVTLRRIEMKADVVALATQFADNECDTQFTMLAGTPR